MKTVEQNEPGPVREGSPEGASRLWWERLVEKVIFFQPGVRFTKDLKIVLKLSKDNEQSTTYLR